MKKRFSAFLLLLLLVSAWLFLQGKRYPWETGSESALFLPNDGRVHLVLEEGTLSPTGATFSLRNDTQETISFGAEYSIQVWSRGGWHDICLTDTPCWPLYAYLAGPGVHTVSIDWDSLYGPLPHGCYRLVKPYSCKSNYDHVCCEFTVDLEEAAPPHDPAL